MLQTNLAWLYLVVEKIKESVIRNKLDHNYEMDRSIYFTDSINIWRHLYLIRKCILTGMYTKHVHITGSLLGKSTADRVCDVSAERLFCEFLVDQNSHCKHFLRLKTMSLIYWWGSQRVVSCCWQCFVNNDGCLRHWLSYYSCRILFPGEL